MYIQNTLIRHHYFPSIPNCRHLNCSPANDVTIAAGVTNKGDREHKFCESHCFEQSFTDRQHLGLPNNNLITGHNSGGHSLHQYSMGFGWQFV